jgi:hypothetical protein
MWAEFALVVQLAGYRDHRDAELMGMLGNHCRTLTETGCLPVDPPFTRDDEGRSL